MSSNRPDAAGGAAPSIDSFGPFKFLTSMLYTQLCIFAAVLALSNFYGMVELISRTANSRWTYLPDAVSPFAQPVQDVLKQLIQQVIAVVGRPGVVKLGIKDVVLVAILFAFIYFRPSSRSK